MVDSILTDTPEVGKEGDEVDKEPEVDKEAEVDNAPEDDEVDKEPEGGKDKEVDKEAEVDKAPEKYEDFKLPEGVDADALMMDKLTAVAKELNLTQENAQKLVDLRLEAIEAGNKRQWEVWEKTQEEWAAESKSDKEIGGKDFQENVSIAKKALDAYGNDALKDLTDSTGMGNNKEFIRFLVKIGKDISEDKLLIGGSKTVETGRAARIYDKT